MKPFKNFVEFQKAHANESVCVKLLEQSRWGGNPVCPYCEHTKSYRLKRDNLLKCAKCRKLYTARIGTIFQDSPLPLSKWFYGLYIFMNHKKGISSCQLAKDIGVTQKTAWFMLGRLRYAIRTKSFNKPLEGIIEADETYVGGTMHGGKRGRGSEKKTPVFGMAERNGRVIAMPVAKVNSSTLKGAIRKNVKSGSAIMTDEWKAYDGLSRDYTHERVNHSEMEFARGSVHVNTIEGFWSQLKRGIFGIYHHASPKHLHRYSDEFSYRYNTRRLSDTDRFIATLGQVNGRLTYAQLICRHPRQAAYKLNKA